MTNNCMCEDVSATDHQCRCRGADFVDIPQNLTKSLSILSIQDAGLEVLKSDSLIKYAETLHELNMINLDKFYHIETGVFRNLVQFQTLYIYSAPRLKKILPEVFTAYLPKFKVLRIMYTGLQHVPNLNGLNLSSALNMVDLDHNKVRKISSRDLNGIAISQLILSYNEIEMVQEDAFMDSQIASITLRGNTKLKVLHKKAFRKLHDLRMIDLSDTSITTLPTEGLQDIDILKIENSYSLKVFPSVFNFKNIKEAWLTYPYHCCAFMYPTTHGEYEKHIQSLLQLQEACLKNQSTLNSYPIDYQIPKFPSCTDSDSMWHNEEVDHIFVKHDCDISHEVFCQDFKEVMCYPKPDPFNPCEDLMGNWGLRIPVWIIAHSAAIGNLFVLLVIATSHFRLTVSKFLMCNLAIADLCIGVHLLLLAGIDAHSIGAYFNFAIDWQEGYGCNVAGFLTTFGNVLSVFTLAVITLERWCTITWAAHLHKRLKMRTSVKIMIIGWIAAIIMASLPLHGISSYARTSICLPLEYKNHWDAIYLAALLMINCSAFTIICVCYGSMYRTIRSGTKSGIANSARNDQTVAKKMALLVFTDFACLSPIAFFGFTALLGYPLITVTQTKILLVFVYPLNSCANPCLYAILTQQYRKDFFILLGRLGLCKEYAQYNRGAIRGRPLPYTTKFQRPNGMTRSVSSKSSSHVNRNSLVTTVSNVNVEIPLTSSGKCRDNECKKMEFNSVNL
ncbi:lutropin-choriogonadotropic hormone receptor-like isoform X2 [Anthonomus grandis grandis]|nr:lutropin-choriogonadotropic hormone receptor-like isoform X2 [Anthonomus grandis grandis]